MQVLDLAIRHVGKFIRITRGARKNQPFLIVEGRLDAITSNYNGRSKRIKVILEISGQQVCFHSDDDVELL